MQSVGTSLKEARNKGGYSLDEISARTRINTRNLSAIEDDQVSELSSPFFYRSFVRQYANEVGLEYTLLSPAVEMLTVNMRQPHLPGQGEHKPMRVAPIQARPKRDFSWIVPAALFIGAVALGSGGYAAWTYYKPLSLAQNSAVSFVKNKKSEPNQAPAPKPAVQATAGPDKIHLELAAIERTWLSISADGKPAYTGTLEAAETKVLDGLESAKLRTGNAGGVNITFNGKSIGAIGPRGGTRTVVFTKTGYEVESADTPKPAPASHIGG
jgi:cytoskeleton protein RodZ